MKQRRKAILALLLSASVAASPIVSATSVFAEDLDFATVEETEVTSESSMEIESSEKSEQKLHGTHQGCHRCHSAQS